ncbi:RRQRL motif-containing zinc-binding protein [Streptomyces violaceoruber]|uniref:RRQRL motif-containing zinc-binding protein n=1 Tax=Streptomyces violaceoruber group TaxID=2867121 RepID=UPI0033FF753E
MADELEDLVDIDVYDDGKPVEFGWLQGPNAAAILAAVRGQGPVPKTGLATRRQLRALGLRPGGQNAMPGLSWRNGRRKAYFYRIELALPKRTPTLAQERALDRAMAARQTCPTCRRRYHYCLQAAVLHRMQHTSRPAKSLGCSWVEISAESVAGMASEQAPVTDSTMMR